MSLDERKSFPKLLMLLNMLTVVLVSLISTELPAQDIKETCPCFNVEEVELIFQIGANLAEEEGMSTCSAQDYSVECNAEVIVMDQNYETVAQARVDWYDFDPGGCAYINTTGDPDVERNVRWPHPAPEATARACFNIISNVIKKFDSTGRCTSYP